MMLVLAAAVVLADSLPPVPSPLDIDIARMPRWSERHEWLAAGFMVGGIGVGYGGLNLARNKLAARGIAAYHLDDGLVEVENLRSAFEASWISSPVVIDLGLEFDRKKMGREYLVTKPRASVALPFSRSSLLFGATYHQGRNDDFEFSERGATASVFFSEKVVSGRAGITYSRRFDDAAGYRLELFFVPSIPKLSPRIGFGSNLGFWSDEIFPALTYAVGWGPVAVSGEVGQGPRFDSYDAFFAQDRPVRWTQKIEDEAAHLWIETRIRVMLKRHVIGLKHQFVDWDRRLVFNPGWTIAYAARLNESEAGIFLISEAGRIDNRLAFVYREGNQPIPFRPRFSLQDTLGLRITSRLKLSPSMTFVSARAGLVDSLGGLLFFSVAASFQHRWLKLNGACANVLDRRGLYYDDCPVLGRRFGAGGEVGL